VTLSGTRPDLEGAARAGRAGLFKPVPGDAEDVRQRFEAYRTAGVDESVAFLVSGQSDPQAVRAELEATTAALAPSS